MKKDTKSWNPFVGCRFDCEYCYGPDNYKRFRHCHCKRCLAYEPHTHPDRLGTLPSERVVFVCSTGDISFCPPDYVERIVDAMKADKKRDRVWLLQSKDPICFAGLLKQLPRNVVLMTTIESNRNNAISKAPAPYLRFYHFLHLNWPKKALVMEPILDFDLPIVTNWAKVLKPKAVFIGRESKRQYNLPEPPAEKVAQLHKELRRLRLKTYDKAVYKYRDVF